MFDAESLFFVDDDQAQIEKLDVFGNQAMGPDHDIDLAAFHACDVFFHFLRRAKPAEFGDIERKFAHAFLEVLEVLFGEHGGRNEDPDLVAIFDRLESGPHRDFGFAESDIAAQQPVHGLCHAACPV